MSPETKRFLIGLSIAAFAGWIAGNWFLGPPGLSSEYLDGKRAAHEHYVEIIKSPDFKRYRQRPNLADLSSDEALQQRVEFVQQYEADGAFREEQHRIELYTLFFEFFNAGLVVVLAVRLGKAPAARFLGEQIETLRERMNQAARSRKSAESRRAAAGEKIDRLPEMEMRLHAETERRLERELDEYSEANLYSMGLQQRELAERKKAVVHRAERALRRQLVDAAITELTQAVQQGQSVQKHAALIDDFITQIEAER